MLSFEAKMRLESCITLYDSETISPHISIFALFRMFSKKRGNDEQDALLLLLALSTPTDRAENYDRDVQIITYNSSIPPAAGAQNYNCDINYSTNDVDHFKELLQTQIEQYPRGYLIKGKVERIILCANLMTRGRTVDSFADFRQSAVYLNVSPSISNGVMDQRINRVIHHEITHNVDYAIRGFLMYVHTDWSSLNTVGYVSNVDWSLPNLLRIDNPVPGYITTYATSNVVEDYAEIGMGLLGSSSSYNQLLGVCRTDLVVRAKVNLMISDMRKFWPFSTGEGTLWERRISEANCD